MLQIFTDLQHANNTRSNLYLSLFPIKFQCKYFRVWNVRLGVGHKSYRKQCAYKAVQTVSIYLSEPKSVCPSAVSSFIDSKKSDQLLCLLKLPLAVVLKGLALALNAIALDMLETNLDARALAAGTDMASVRLNTPN